MNKKYAVILSGSGAKDGSEIHESVLALLAIVKSGNSYTVFAPNINQSHVVNHIDDSEMEQVRNVMIESSRISRGNICDLETIDINAFDGVVIPGGFGAAKNLFDFAFNYTDFTIIPLVEKVVRGFHSLGKPIGAMCISPVMIAKMFGNSGVEITLGEESQLSKDIESTFGANVITAKRDGIVVDSKNKIVTTPSYMYGDSSILDIATGADNLIKELDKLNNSTII